MQSYGFREDSLRGVAHELCWVIDSDGWRVVESVMAVLVVASRLSRMKMGCVLGCVLSVAV